jgi:hypothetical protein
MPYLTAAGSVLMGGPSPFVVSLGIENFVSLPTAYMLYNYIAIGFLLLLTAAVGPRGEARFCVTLPIFAGVFAWFGWLHAPNPAQTYAVIIISGILGIAIYMNEVNREKYGVKGPGNKLLNIVYFLVLFQVATGVVTGMNLFDIGTTGPQATNMCVVGNNTWGAQCNSAGNVQIRESVASVSDSGGLLGDIMAMGSLLLSIGLALLKMLVTIALSIVAFPVILNGVIAPIFPGITANTIYLVFLGALEAVCLINFTLLMFVWFFKPNTAEPL